MRYSIRASKIQTAAWFFYYINLLVDYLVLIYINLFVTKLRLF